MAKNFSRLFHLPRPQLHAMANAALAAQAAKIYTPEALTVVKNVFQRNTAIMGVEQLAHIIINSEAS